MKKLLFVLLIVALASYLFVGCMPVTPSEGEGEGEGEAGVVISDAVKVGDYTYISEGNHTITVTFPAPIVGVVTANITACGGDYRPVSVTAAAPVVLFPDATKKVWTGSGTFTASASGCCASYVEVVSGECADVVCIAFPVIIDGEKPYAEISITTLNCECEGCAVTFSSTKTDPLCEEAELCCGDDCSGLASWSINLYDAYPFNVCCDPSVCEEPIATDSGLCPIDFTTACLPAGDYWAVISLVDNVGLEQNYYAHFHISGGIAGGTDCVISGIEEGTYIGYPGCITWEIADTIGACDSIGPQPDGEEEYTVALSDYPAGAADSLTGAGTYNVGDSVDISATASDGYTFVNWTDDDDGDAEVSPDATYNFTMLAVDVNYTANFRWTGEGPEAVYPAVYLGMAGGNFVILAETKVTDAAPVSTQIIGGDVGLHPATADGNMDGLDCATIDDTVYITSGAGPATIAACSITNPTLLGIAVGDMEDAYTDGFTRTAGSGSFLNPGTGGDIAGLTLASGVYTFNGASGNVHISTDVYINGSASDVWIFQIEGTFDNSANVILTGGALPEHIFWVVAGETTLYPGSHTEGIILDKTGISMQSLATITGRLLSQTAVTLIGNTITAP